MSEGEKIGSSITGAFKAVGDLGEGLRKNINGLADSVGRGIANDSSHGGPAVPDTVNHDTLSSTTKPGGTFGDGTHDRSGLTDSTTASGDVHPDVKALGTELEKGVAKLNK